MRNPFGASSERFEAIYRSRPVLQSWAMLTLFATVDDMIAAIHHVA